MFIEFSLYLVLIIGVEEIFVVCIDGDSEVIVVFMLGCGDGGLY